MKIILKGKPISTQHAYWQSGKIRFMTADAKSLKNDYIKQARTQYKGEPLKTSLSMYIRIYFKDKRVRDWDNWHKLSMDALSKIVYDDDTQLRLVTVDLVSCLDKENPRIELIIEELWI